MPDVLNKDIVLKDLDGTQLWPLAHRDSGGYIIEETYLKNYIMKDGVKYPIDPNSLMFLNTSSSNPVIQTLGGDEVNIVDSVEYGLSDSPTTEPTTWYTEIPSTIPEGSYLWTKTSYSNGAVSYSISYQGKDGAPGQSTYIRYIEATADNIIKDRSTNTLTPPTVTFSFKIVAGNSDPAPYSGYYEIKSSQDGSAYTGSTSGTGTSTSAYRPDSADRFVRCYLYNNSTDRTLLDVKTVAILSDGLNGAAGITIDHIEEYYTLTQDTTPVPEPESSEWDWVVGGGSEGLPAMTQTDKYLWNYEKIYYSNNTTYVSDPVIIGAYGDNGRGISSITEYYQVTNSTQAPETGTSDWETTPQQVSENNKYLWNYEYISYTDGTHFESEPAIIGMFSKDGINGTDAYNAILSNENHTFPADDSGHAIDGSSTTGNVLGFEGTSQVATYVDVNNITGTPTGLSFQVSDNGTDHTAYTVTAANTLTTTNGTLSIPVILNHNEDNEVTFYLSFSYSLAKAGTNGNDAEIYYIQTSANTITRSQDNVLSPNQITFSAFKQVGNNNPTAYQGKFYVESTTDFSTWTAFYYTTSSINEDHATISLTGLTSSVLAIRCRFYTAGTVIVPAPSSSEVPLDSQTILFVKDGADAYNIRFRDENISFAGDDTKALAGQSFTTKLDAFRGVNRVRATINPNNSTIQVPTGMSITWNNTLPQADPAPSVTLTISGNMTTQTGTINIPVRVNNRDFTIPLYFNLILKGKNGLDVTSYSVIPNHNYILISTDGTILPSDSVTFYAYKLIGSNRDAFTCNFRIYVMNNGASTWTQVYPSSGQSAANESSHTYQISNIEITGIKAEIYSGNTKLDEESIPVLTRARDGTDGNDGEPGYSTAIIYLYQRASDTPEKPIGDFTYTFSDGSLTPEEGADLNGWSLTIPGQDSAGDPLWVTVAMASSNGESDTIGEDEWQNPVIFSENGADGTPAYNNASVSLYRRSTTEPTVPSGTLTYNFTTGELTPASGYTGWSRYIPTGTDPVWVITANLSSLSSTDTITSQEWNGTGTAVRLARDGNDLSVSGVYYAESDQGTDPTLIPAVDWEISMPDVGPGNFLWTRIDYSDGSHSYSSTRQGVNGGDVTISSTSVKYSRSDSGTSTPSYWGDTPSTAKRKGQPGNYTYGPAEPGDYLWVRTIVNYSPSGSTTSYSISYIGTDGEDGNSAVIESVSKSSEGVTTIVMVDGEGNRSTITIDDGQDGENGRPGENGYVHIAWANSANGQTDFSTTVSTNKKYVGMYTDNTEADSQNYLDYSWSLIKGTDGLNQATITLYRRSSSNLTNSDRPSVAVKYTFSTGELSVNNTVTAGPIATNWYRNIPTGTDPVWITTASAISAEASTTITRTTGWSTPVKMVVNGVDGYNTATIYLYRRSTSNLTNSDRPSTSCYYRFSDKTLSLSNTSWSAITSLNNWSTTIPTGTNPIWVTAASVTSQSNISPVITQSNWATPVKMAQSGTDGTSSCLVVLDNDSHIFPATDTHAINNSQAVINITGYEGTTQLTAKADIENLTNGSFAIREISGTIANKLTVSSPTVSNNAIVLTVTALERLDSNNKAGVLNFLIDVKTSTGATLQYNKKFSWSLGLEGSDGDPAEIYYLTLSNNIIKKGYNSSGTATVSPSNITVTVYKRVGNDSPTTSSDCYVEITKDNSVVSNTKTSSITYPTSGSLPTNISSLVFKLYDTNNSSTRKLLDTQSVGIIDGTISVKGVTEYYKTTTTNSAPATTDLSTWFNTPTAAGFSATNKYLWNTETVQYSNGTSGSASAAALIGTWGEAGSGISSIKEYYLKSNQSTGITTSTSGWVEVPGTGSTPNPVPVTSEDEPYLWNYEKITWVNPSSVTNTTPAIVGVHGRRGEHGFNTATARLYRVSDNTPTAKPGDLTYTFSTGLLSGSTSDFNGWQQTMPDTVPIWEITATALSDTDEDTITGGSSGEWSAPRLISGKNGTNGYNQATIYLYKRSTASTETKPTTTSYYKFSTGKLYSNSGATTEITSLNSWYRSIPTDSNNPIWVTAASVKSTSDIVTISGSDWVNPAKLAQDGTNGTSPYLMTLSNDSHSFPAGVSSVTSDSAETITINVYEGSTQLTNTNAADSSMANGTFRITTATVSTISPSGKFTAVPSNPASTNKYGTVTATAKSTLTTPSGTVTIKVNVKPIGGGSVVTLEKVFSWSLAFTGQTGSGATNYYLVLSNTAVKKNLTLASNNITPNPITVNAYSKTGTDSPVSYSGYILAKYTTTSGTSGSQQVTNNSLTIGSAWNSLVIELYTRQNGTLLDSQSVAILSDGINSTTVYLYKNNNSSPGKPTASSTYTFSTKTLNPIPSGWSTTPAYSNSTSTWEIRAVALSNTDTDTIAYTDWSDPILISGKNGTNGTSQATLYVYKRAASVPNTPSGGSYTFSSGSFTAPNDWSATPVEKDSSHDWPCWVSSATVIGTGTVSVTGWTTPVIYISKEMSVVSSRPLWYLKNSLLGIELSGNTSQAGTPTPSAPQTIHSVKGNNKIKIIGKNMFSGAFENPNTYSMVNNNGEYSITTPEYLSSGLRVNITTKASSYAVICPTVSSCSDIRKKLLENPNTRYTISFDVYSSTGYTFSGLSIRRSNGQSTIIDFGSPGIQANTKVRIHGSGTTEVVDNIDQRLYINISGLPSGSFIELGNFQLELGSSETSYEPYDAHSYSLTLGGRNMVKPYDSSESKQGITCTYNAEEQSWTFNGTCDLDNTTFSYTTEHFNIDKNVTTVRAYWVSGSVTGTCTLRAFDSAYVNSISVDLTTLSANNRVISQKYTGNSFTTNSCTIRFNNGSVATNFKIKIMIANDNDLTYEPYISNPIELNKIGTYSDYFYKNGDKWYVHKEFNKVDLGTLTWAYNTTGRVFYANLNPAPPTHTNTTKADAYCSKYPITTWSGKTDKSAQIFYAFVNGINIEDETYTDARTFKSSISGTELVYRIATPTNTEITDTTLIAQLNNLETAQSSSSKVTNILQENSDLPFDITYSEANTGWPSKPTSEVTTTSTAPDIWSLMPATYIEGYRYYNSYQTKLSDGSLFWSEVTPGTAIQNADGIYAGISNQAQVFNVNKNGVFDTDTPSEGITVWGIIGTEEVVPTNISVNYNETNILNNATTASIYARLSSNVVTITFKAGFPGGTTPISEGTINIEFVVGTKSFKFPYNFTLVKRNKQITEIRPLYYLKQSNTVAPSSPAQQSGWPNISNWTSTSPNIWSTKKPDYIKPTITFDGNGNPVVGNDVYYYWTCQVTKYNDGSTDISTIILDSELNSVELTVSTNSAKITENEKDILARVTQTDFDLTLNGDGTTTNTGIKGAIGQLQLTAEDYTSKVSSFATKTDLNGYVTTTTYNSYINQTAKEITRGLQQQITNNEGLIKNIEGGVKVELVNNKTQVTIGNSESEVRGVFTNTALEFKNKSDQRLAWLDSTDGLGATSLSLGSASTVSNRWRIIVSDDGNHLTFTRHN